MNKKIFVKSTQGFGNKIISLIYCIYYYKIYKCNIYFIEVKSKHNIKDDIQIKDIFLKTHDIINYKDISYIEYIKNKVSQFNINILNVYTEDCETLNDLPIYDKLEKYNVFIISFHLVKYMWDTFDEEDKKYFEINLNLIDENLRKYETEKYAVIHIRYGDKISIALQKNKSELYPIYTPKYYKKIISKLEKKSIKILLITDSPILVKKFILKKNINPNIKLIETHWLNAFYILLHGYYIYMSYSTFSFMASYFNNNTNAKFYLLQKIKTNYNYLPEDDMLLSKWIFFYKKKYILNYKKKLLQKMYKINL